MTKEQRTTESQRLIRAAKLAEAFAKTIESSDPTLASSERARAARLRRRASVVISGR